MREMLLRGWGWPGVNTREDAKVPVPRSFCSAFGKVISRDAVSRETFAAA
tara:strand:+ start:862 stop:1011 length:150 start_codon:yes stop_codon:yes gene_type:complete